METVKGFKDYSGEEALKREKVKSIIENIFKKYNFEPAETPIIEYEEFVKQNPDDEAVSDVFKLQDKGKRKLALRYELTFQLKRLMKNKKLPYRRYQIGKVFRDEPVSSNRFRQFTQCDIDVINSTIKDDAEILKITSDILNKLNIKFTININNRKLLNEILEKLKIKNKIKVIKEIDKLDKLSESEVKKNLNKYNAESVLKIFKKPESYFEKYSSYNEIKELKKLCRLYKIKINFQPSLARGLSYYNGNVFEIKSSIKETIIAGGNYIFNNIQCSGISFGLERLTNLAKISINKNRLLIISLNKDKEAINLAEKTREFIPTQIYYGKIKKALDYANSCNFPYVLFIGEEELKKEKIKIKNMKSGKEIFIGVNNLVKYITNLK